MRNVRLLWSVIAVLLVAVLILSFVLTANSLKPSQAGPSSDQETAAGKDRVIAKVGDKTITNLNLEEQLRKKYGRELMNQMIDHEVIVLEGKAQGLSVSESEVQQELQRMQQGYDSESQFYQAMKEQLGFTPETLRRDINDRLLIEKIATLNIHIADETVDAYVQTHPEEFRANIRLRLQQIVVSSKDQADKAMGELAKGADFAQVAKNRSLDDATRDSGGDMGWVEEGDPFIDAAIMKTALKLKVGEVSKPFESAGKLVILLVKDRKDPPKESQAQVREKVRKELALRESPPIKEVIAGLRDKWKVAILETF